MAEQHQEDADWIHWILQFILGALVGAVLAYLLCWRILDFLIGEWILVLIFVSGGALAVGGLAAFAGERLWLGRNAYLDMRNVGQRTKFSNAVAVVAMASGIAAMLGALAGYWIIAG